MQANSASKGTYTIRTTVFACEKKRKFTAVEHGDSQLSSALADAAKALRWLAAVQYLSVRAASEF
jgi:hypothetical protein